MGPAESLERIRRRYRRPHQRVLAFLAERPIPFLVGGGHALRQYTGRVRGTRDLDLFVRRSDALRLLEALGALGLETDLPFPHWLGKARLGSECIDVIYSSGNGIAAVDDEWFAHAVPATVLGVRVQLSPPEEMIWSTPVRIAVLHYSPIAETVEGEPREIFPFLGSSRLEEPLLRYPVAAVFHGHAHRGRPEGRTRGDVPVYNVCLPLLREIDAARPFRVVEVGPA